MIDYLSSYPETWNTNSSAAEVVSIRSFRLNRLISLALMSATVRSGPLAVLVAVRVRPHHPIYGFRLAFWWGRTYERNGKVSSVNLLSKVTPFAAQ